LLDRMNNAVEALNYRGTFVHVVDGNAENLHIVHRNAGGVIGEKISSRDGAGREIFRTKHEVRSVLPEERRVLLEEPRGSSMPLGSSFLSYTDDLEQHYELGTFPRGPVAGRETQFVSIKAKDEYRYSFKLWLDQQTGLPLKLQVQDERGRVVESILFTELTVVDAIPVQELEPAIDTEGFEWVRRIQQPESQADNNESWRATNLPSGFRPSVDRLSLLAGSKYPVRHLVFTDGLATVSVFIAHPKSDADLPEGFRRFGSTNFYSLKIDGRLVTAMGEVPRRTVQRIATSLDAR
jgi:sigma-E factor negative regulatory protein RseB